MDLGFVFTSAELEMINFTCAARQIITVDAEVLLWKSALKRGKLARKSGIWSKSVLNYCGIAVHSESGSLWQLIKKAVANTAYMPGLLNAAPGTYADVSYHRGKPKNHAPFKRWKQHKWKIRQNVCLRWKSVAFGKLIFAQSGMITPKSLKFTIVNKMEISSKCRISQKRHLQSHAI